MNPNPFPSVHSGGRALLRLLPLSLIMSAVIVTGGALTIDRPASSQGLTIRQIKIKRNADHPVTIRQIRNAQNPQFLQDVEIEIQNVSTKPIYYVRLYVRFPGIEVEPKRYYAFSLYYGDPKFDPVDRLADPQDEPIPVGGTVTLKVPDRIREGFAWYKTQKNLPATATNIVEIQLEEVSFGDGTGYDYGKPYPRPSNSVNLR